MMVMYSDIISIDHDGRRLGLPNAPVFMEQDNNITEIEQ